MANTINDKTARWFVMKLRSGVKPDDVKAVIDSDIPSLRETIGFYYPVHTVRKREGRKIVKEEVPYIPGLLFFRMRGDLVTSLFAGIGHLAWCFRKNGDRSGDYSSIPSREMEKFQKYIGEFTPDIKISLASDLPEYAVGDRVRVNGGDLLCGREGVIEKITNSDGSRTFILRLSSNDFISWTAQVEDIYVSPVRASVNTVN